MQLRAPPKNFEGVVCEEIVSDPRWAAAMFIAFSETEGGSRHKSTTTKIKNHHHITAMKKCC